MRPISDRPVARLGALIALFVLAVGGTFAVIKLTSGPSEFAGAPVELDGVGLLPDESLSDWVTYADAVVVVRATAERALAASPEELEAGEGLRIRMVTLEIEEVLWTTDQRVRIPAAIEIPHGGWLFHGTEESRALLAESVSLDVGHSFVAPIYFEPADEPAWMALSPSSILPFDEETVGAGTSLDSARAAHTSESRPDFAKLWGAGADVVTKSLDTARRDPLATKFAELKHRALYEAIVATRERG